MNVTDSMSYQTLNWSSYYQNRNIHQEFQRKAARYKEYFESIYRIAKGAQVLEIGVGFATCMSVLSVNYGLLPIGIDASQQMLEIARRNVLQVNPALSERLLCGSGMALPFTSNSFVLVYSQGLLEHFSNEDIRLLISEGLRVARYFVFSVPSCHYSDKQHLIGDERLLCKHQWERILKGFNLVSSEYHHNEEHYYAIITK